MMSDFADLEFKLIPGFNNKYYINRYGVVRNKSGHALTPIMTKFGPAFELRNSGQREKVLIIDLLKLVKEYDSTRID